MGEANEGQKMYALCAKMFPYCRSITGDGVRETLATLQEIVPEITVHEVKSGTKAFDWTVPKEVAHPRCLDKELSWRKNCRLQET